jgi:polyisoprenyl-phosphate glycosyltransferase
VISIVIPCHNEAENVERVIEAVGSYLNAAGEPYEFIFVDDGSTDQTLKILKRNVGKAPLRYISFSRNFGHQTALKAGLDRADGDAVITMDGDLQHPPKVILDLLSRWKEGYKIVNTMRVQTANEGFLKRATSKWFYWMFNQMTGVPLDPGSADFRLLDRQVVLELRRFGEGPIFLRGLVNWIGFKRTCIRYVADARFSGRTKYSFKRMIRFGLDGIMSFSIRPLRAAGLLGLMVSLLSALYLAYSLFIVLFTERAVPGWASILMSILFIGGVQMIFLGLLGEYVGKMFMENKRRPSYVIEETNY